jgi:hypothetical protein
MFRVFHEDVKIMNMWCHFDSVNSTFIFKGTETLCN